MMNTVFLIILTFFMISCDSKLVTQEDEEIVSELKNIEDPPSGLEIVENSNYKTQVSCVPKNSLKMISTQNQKEPLVCRETSNLDPSVKLGPICPGGVSIKAITSKSEWGPCEKVSVCGTLATSVTDLRATPTAQLKQLVFTNLPWGCKSEIEIRKASSEVILKKIDIEIKVPQCPTCSVNNTQTCEVCGDDTTPPIITDVFTESFQCNKIKVLIFASDENAGIAESGYSFDGGKTWQKESEKDYTGLELNLSIDTIWVRDRAGNIAKYSKDVRSSSSPCPCSTPWGEIIAHGHSRTAYKSQTVACTTTCAANSTQRSCNNGVLSGGAEFSSSSCTVVGCPKCKLPWGVEIENGVQVDAFNVSNAPCAGECKKATLRCDRGTLIGNTSIYKNKACAYNKPSCDCTHEGLIVKNGESKTVYSSSEVNCGSTCTAGSVTCTSGNLSGQTTYTHFGCSPKICKCTTAWGEQIDLNTTLDAYRLDKMNCGESISCDHSSNKIKIKCTDVVANKIDVVEGVGDLNVFNKPTCSASACGCSHLGVIFKPTDEPLKVYKIEEAVSPARCDLAGNYGTVRCVQSGTGFVTTGDKNTTIFKYLSCQDKAVPGTGEGSGTSPLDIGVGIGGGAGGGIGNGEGDGEGFSRRLHGGGGGGGGGCDINQPPYYCFSSRNEARVDMSFCLLPGINGYSASNTNEDNFMQRMSYGGALTLYSKKEVACGDSCAKYMAVVSCDNGFMSQKSKFKYLDCREVCP